MSRPLSRGCRALLVAVLCCLGGSAHANLDDELAALAERFEAGECGNIVVPLKALRTKLKARKLRDIRLDYMYAVCRCRQPGLKMLQLMPKAFRRLPSADRDLLAVATRNCAAKRPTLAVVTRGSVGVSGKGGRATVMREAGRADNHARFRARRFERGRHAALIAHLRQEGVVGPAVSTAHFLLMGPPATAALGQKLEEAAAGLGNALDLTPPPYLITAYVFADRSSMVAHAQRHHGLSMPDALWAYAIVQDSSITVDLSRGLGTFGHEVAHILLDTHAPYAPPWVNEGAAALYEEYGFDAEGALRGIFRPTHWRVPHLRQGGRVPLTRLFALDWADFDDPAGLQLNHANAKFFALYLQERGRLKAVLGAYVDVDLPDVKPADAVLEEAFGQPLDEIEADFDRWLQSLLGPVGEAAPPAAMPAGLQDMEETDEDAVGEMLDALPSGAPTPQIDPRFGPEGR